MSAGRRIAALSVAVAVAACVNNRIDSTPLEQVILAPDARIAVLRRLHSTAPETEAKLTECLSRRLRGQGFSVAAEAELSDALYPWLEPRLAPISPKALQGLLKTPRIAERVEDLGVDYWIWIQGNTESTNRKGSMTCALGPVSGCVGLGIWERDGDYEAVIWRTGRPGEVGRVSSAASGTSVMLAVVLPVPLLARSQAAACRGMARRLGHFLSGAPAPAAPEEAKR